MSHEIQGVDWRSIQPTKLVVIATSLKRAKKNNFRFFIYGKRSTNHANFVKIGAVDVEIISLKEITNMFLKQQHNIFHPRLGG